MTTEEEKWFKNLTAKRQNAVDVLEEEGLIKVFVSHIVDTYRESAHFIYELLQNADDVNAKKVRFELKDDGLVFAHDGSVNFSITDPYVERQKGVVPGHINAITTFSLSPKKEDIENKIGKFGIGFKSVFQYTDTPHIFNPPYKFKIERYMIPFPITVKNSFLETGETTSFWLPFNKKDKTIKEAYNEIISKLNGLKNPLLFLRSLESIQIKCAGKSSLFSKKVLLVKKIALPDIEVKEVTLDADLIIGFDRKVYVMDKNNVRHLLPISVGFIVDKNVISAHEKFNHYTKCAWCFFPTMQPTGLNYIINAPFVLTPNREALKEQRTENGQLISELARLMEVAMQGLKELGYITEEFFTTIPMPLKMPLDFKPVGEKIINKLKSGEFMPTADGKHISTSNAYICSEPLLTELLTYDNGLPLKRLTKKTNAIIIFPDRKLFTDQNLFIFIYQNFSAARSELNANWLGGQYSVAFIENMPEEFDILFFEYVAERAKAILAKGQPLWAKPFIPVHNGLDELIIVKPNNDQGEPQVFVGGSKIKGRYVIVDYLENKPEIKSFLLNTLNFKIPDQFDDFLLSLSKYESENSAVTEKEIISDNLEIKRLLYESSPNNKSKLIKKLKAVKFLPVKDLTGKKSLVNPFSQVAYLPSIEITQYFSKGIDEITWLNVEILGIKERAEDFSQFIEELTIEVNPYYFSENKKLAGLTAFLVDISLTESLYLGKILYQKGCYEDIAELKTEKWMYDKDGIRKTPKEIRKGDLHSLYPDYFSTIHVALGGIVEVPLEKYAGLNEIEKEIMSIINNSSEQLSPDEIKNAISDLIKEKNLKIKKYLIETNNKTPAAQGDEFDSTTPEGIVNTWVTEPLANTVKRDQEGWKNENFIPSIPNSIDFWQEGDLDNSYYADNPGGYLSSSVIGIKYKHDTENSKRQQIEKDIERETKRNKLLELAHRFEAYSFGWFKTLLELEDNFTSEDRIKRHPLRIVFNKASMDIDGLLTLSDTAYIPPTIEEIGDLSIQLFFGDDKKTIKGEVVSPKKHLLLVKLSNLDALKDVDLKKLSYAAVEASSPDFILEKLKLAFTKLNFEDSDSLKNPDIFPKDLHFVFGPPGTGKTSYLSWLIGGKNSEPILFAGKMVIPIMEQNNKRVLVLTPTNKAADVLTERIIKNYQQGSDYPQWLIRFGQSQNLETEPVFVGDRILKPWVYDKCTVVTTIARYPYDHFRIETKSDFDQWRIKDFNWDVIVFDEASMIHQSAILYVIFYSRQINPNVQIIIGGDPFQIPPIIQFEYPYWSYIPEPAVDEQGSPIFDEHGEQVAWRQDGGNIYAFVGLMKDDSFNNPVTVPHQFQVHNLRKQYRSIVPIGALFSHFRYGGQLSHHRTKELIAQNVQFREKEIEIKNLPIKPLTFIKFPVKKYDGVYKVRTINGSPYQLYSSLFSVELIKYILANATIKAGEKYKIGVITPYAVQNNIITKLLAPLNSNSIEVLTGTVHSFQGDECNLVVVVLNPPKYINRGLRIFLNKKIFLM